MEKVKIAVFVSGGGTNLQAIIDAQENGVIQNAKRNDLTGNLLAICGLSELIDVEYFACDTKPAIRFTIQKMVVPFVSFSANKIILFYCNISD